MEKMYTIIEAAKLLKVHPLTIWRKVNSKEIREERIGRLIRIRESELRAYLSRSLPQKVDHSETMYTQVTESKKKRKIK